MYKIHDYTCGLYYKTMTIVNDDSRVINKLEEASLTDDARVVIYDHHMFKVARAGIVFSIRQKACVFTLYSKG
jgi:hypothetical protein